MSESGNGVRLHYPVTRAYWHGVFDLMKPYPGRLRRACDWMEVTSEQVTHWRKVTCDDCLAYIAALKRLFAKK